MRKIIFLFILSCFIGLSPAGILAQEQEIKAGLLPDSPFYFLKTWKESIQTFFIFGEENKAKQFLHLSEIRLAEYQKMIEKGKTEIAQKTLEKYEKQLGYALEKADEAQEKGKDVEKLKEVISEKILKHQEVLESVLEKVSEEAREGIERAIETPKKGFEKVIEAITVEKESGEGAEKVKETLEEKPEAKTEGKQEFLSGGKCSDGTPHEQYSVANPGKICKNGVLTRVACAYANCPAEYECLDKIGGCNPPVFPRKDMEQYATWEKINAVLSEFGITAVQFDGNWQPMAPSNAQREMMRESLAQFTYALDSVFQETRIKEFLKGLKQIAIHEKDFVVSLEHGVAWQYRPNENDITMPPRTPLNPPSPAYTKDQYISKIIHEIAHAIDINSLSKSGIIENFRKICWEGSNIKTSCYEREKSFVPWDITTEKYFAEVARELGGTSALGPDYYSAKNFQEDFAESVVAYIVSPNEFRDLAQKYPILSQKYEFIKTNVFDGKEFQEYKVK